MKRIYEWVIFSNLFVIQNKVKIIHQIPFL